MSLHLDTRQRAMLREMGVHVWQPTEPEVLAPHDIATFNAAVRPGSVRATAQNSLKVLASESPTPVPDKLAAATATAATVPEPGAELPSHEHFSVLTAAPKGSTATLAGPLTMGWPELKQTVLTCRACAMGEGRQAPVLAALTEAVACDWMVVGDPPDDLQERLGQPFAGEPGQLLDKMLRAVGAQRFPAMDGSEPAAALQGPASARAYLSHVLKCRPARMRAPVAAELAACAGYLRREIALVQPKVIVTMGRFAMQTLLSDMPAEQVKLPLGQLRGRVWQFAGVPVVVTYPPDYLLSNAPDKAKAWADLQLAMAVVRGEPRVLS